MKNEKEPSPEVVNFAHILEKWAQEDPERARLMKWLLTRCESRSFKGPPKVSNPETKDKFLVERISIDDISIYKAVQRAMINYNPDLPTSGWVRGGPIWPMAYGDIWLKAYGS